MARYCIKCGEKYEGVSQLCPACEQQAANSIINVNGTSVQEGKRKPVKKITGAAIAGVMIVLLAVAGVYFIHQRQDTFKDVSYVKQDFYDFLKCEEYHRNIDNVNVISNEKKEDGIRRVYLQITLSGTNYKSTAEYDTLYTKTDTEQGGWHLMEALPKKVSLSMKKKVSEDKVKEDLQEKGYDNISDISVKKDTAELNTDDEEESESNQSSYLYTQSVKHLTCTVEAKASKKWESYTENYDIQCTYSLDVSSDTWEQSSCDETVTHRDYNSADSTIQDDMDVEEEDDSDYSDSANSSSNFQVLKFSSSRKVTAADLSGLSKSQLRIARNEIYARNGRRFTDDDLQKYFDKQSWYYGEIEPEDFVDSEDLSALERRNVKFIKKYEDKK